MPNNYSDYDSLLENQNIKAFLLLIRYAEGTDGVKGYYTLVRGIEKNGKKAPLYFSDMSDHPQFSSEHFPGILLTDGSGRISTAAGAYQFIGSTWKEKQNTLGLPDFSPHSQDMAALLNIGTYNLKLIQEGNVSLVINNLNGQWSSFPGGSQQRITLARALAVYQANGGVLNPNDSLIASTSNYKATDPGKAQSTDGNKVDNIEINFREVELNYASMEADNAFQTPWGGQLVSGEESGYIGLKQYLLYLTSKFYPQNLVPFVELIPVYTIENSSKKVFGKAYAPDIPNYVANPNPPSDDSISKYATKDASLYTPLVKTAAENNFMNSKTLVDNDRFDTTARKLFEGSKDGAIDIFTTDPFKESTDAFNISNADDKALREKRGFGFKIFGNLSVNPSLQFNETSKAGEVGLKSLEIEIGSQTHFGLTLVTIKFLDVQGNKFLDVNSPWSFILNSRPGMNGGDFYFRYGWQINIPDENREDDDQAKKFWNHKGWFNFQGVNVASGSKDVDGGKAIKKIIKDIAARGNGTLTLTQSNTQKSFSTPGFNQDKNGFFSYNRNLDWTLYDTLTLINPELDVDPSTGAMTATLYFRANSGVANCLALLNGSGNNGNLWTKKLCKESQTNTTTLSRLMAAFVVDNFNYINNNPAFKGIKTETGNRSIFLSRGIENPKDVNVQDWLTVVGGAGTDSLIGVNPDLIPIKFDNDDLQAFETKTDDTRLLIAWLNLVLSKNHLTIITAGSDNSQSSQSASAANVVSNVPMGGFLIAYDNTESGIADKVQKIGGQNLSITNKTFADYRKYINNQSGAEDFIGNRLTVQDDVFSFKFQGSLVETINIEKLEQPTQSLILANQNLAGEIDPNDTDIQKGTAHDGSQFDTQNSAVTFETKKYMLNLLYSSMLGLKVESICHPWIRLCRPVFVKGMGFWDGQYMATKVVHHLTEDNKFTSTINACRVWNKDKMDENLNKQSISQLTNMNYPGVNLASETGLVKNTNPTNSSFQMPTTTPEGYSNGSIYTFRGIQLGNKVVVPLRPSLENYIRNLHYAVQNDFREFIRTFESQNTNYLVLITSGYRSFQEQFILYNQNQDNAIPGYSMHNFGMACDINLLNSKTFAVELNKSTENNIWITTGIVDLAKSRGFTWGGDQFNSYRDSIHFGFDNKFDIDILIVLAKKQFGSLENTIGNQLILPNTTRNIFNGMDGGTDGGGGASGGSNPYAWQP